MKITTLIENTTLRDDLAAEHGLSLYIETSGLRILFDAGQTGAFADNAEKLGIDLNQVDLCVLSHGHYDHGGGLSRFLAINKHAPVYLSSHAFGSHYSSGNYIGLDPALQGDPRLIHVSGDLDIACGIRLFSCNDCPRPYSFGAFGQTRLSDGIHIPEDYRHEQYLLVEENGQKVCISGCSHKGVLNILSWLQPDVFIGGFHFIRMDPDGCELAAAAGRLRTFPTRYYTGHCTGPAQYSVLKEILPDRLEYLSTGTVIQI